MEMFVEWVNPKIEDMMDGLEKTSTSSRYTVMVLQL